VTKTSKKFLTELLAKIAGGFISFTLYSVVISHSNKYFYKSTNFDTNNIRGEKYSLITHLYATKLKSGVYTSLPHSAVSLIHKFLCI